MSMRKRPWAVRVMTLLMAVAAVPVVGAGAARAAVSGLELVETHVTMVANSARTVTLTCRSGWVAVSGGWHVDGGDHLYGLVIRESRPESEGWRFRIYNTAQFHQQMALRATCVRDSEGVSITARGALIPFATSVHVVATCPTGTKILGGGFLLFHNNVVPLWSTPQTQPQGWDGYFHSKTDGTTSAAYTYAVCGRVANHYLTSAAITVDPGQEGASHVSCDGGELSSIGGGWRHGFTDHMPLRQSLPYDKKSWRNTVKNMARSVQIQVTTLAVCIGLS